MKYLLVFGLVCILMIPFAIMGCSKTTTPSTTPVITNNTMIPASTNSTNEKTIDLTLDNFETQKNIFENIELNQPGTLTVRLGSNASTGFEWGDPVISDTNIIVQSSQNSVAPTNTNLVGSPGTDVRAFNTVNTGTATIKLSYNQPWTGGEKDIYTLTINVTVK